MTAADVVWLTFLLALLAGAGWLIILSNGG